jgi:glycosyltransferase involved in cell wall biosynthesis
MKIGFVYDMIYPYSKGGAEKRFYHLASRLAERHEVHWVGLKLWQGPRTIVTESGVILHGVAAAPGRMYVDGGRRSILEPVWFGTALFQWTGLRNMDVIDCSSFPFFSIFSSKTLALLGRVPLVTTWHEFWGDYWKQYAPRVAFIGRLVERLALSCSGTVISVSQYTRDKLIQAGLKDSKVSVVPNGIDLEAIDRADAVPDGPDVLFVGRLIPEKRVAALLEALSTEPLRGLGATCRVIGDGPEAERLKGLANERGLASRVRFDAWVPEEEVYGAMKSAKVVTLLSEREGFGMVVLEAMACGTPTVVSTGTNSAAPDLVQSGETGYVVPCEPQALSQAIASIIGSPERRSQMGGRGKGMAKLYGWDHVTKQAEAVYEAAAGMAG